MTRKYMQINHQENSNENHSDLSPYSCWNGCSQNNKLAKLGNAMERNP